jgi:RimJ/RimL family protein N-acetyltransferase
VLLRAPSPADTAAVFAAVDESKETVGRWMDWCHPDYALEDADAWVAKCQREWLAPDGERDFLVTDAATGDVLGCMGVNQFNRVNQFCNLGYWIRASRVRQGFTSSGVRLLARWTFETLPVVRIEIMPQVTNRASRAVAEKVGCKFEGVQRNRLSYRGQHFDAAMYSLLPSDLEA